ncbi:MAG: hypothetical protein ABI841_07055, partial [Chloroflexota bacterium]
GARSGARTMAWIDDGLPLPAARLIEGEEALEAALHALAALAAGIAAMQTFVALVVGDSLSAAFFTAALLATAACAFVSDGSRVRRAAFIAGGGATVLVWLAVLPQTQGQPMAVAVAMAGVSAVVTRRLLVGDREPPREARRSDEAIARPVGWIEDDCEGTLAGT